jgi:hypothetical protein
MPSVLNAWVADLTYMQQSVLLSLIRNEDGLPKFHPQKKLLKWYRRCVLLSAFDGRELRDPHEAGGGSFTGPIPNLQDALDEFIVSRDSMSLHYYAHAMHGFEILGYKHPDIEIQRFWRNAYYRMVEALHVWPETEEQMDSRLGDKMEGWVARNDPCGTCSD